MAAIDNVSNVQMWHVAPSRASESIEKNGIDYRHGTSKWRGIDFPKGNYVFTNEDAAKEYAETMDQMERDNGGDYDTHTVWHIPKFSGTIHRDPFEDDESGLGKFSRYTEEPISPTAIRRK